MGGSLKSWPQFLAHYCFVAAKASYVTVAHRWTNFIFQNHGLQLYQWQQPIFTCRKAVCQCENEVLVDKRDTYCERKTVALKKIISSHTNSQQVMGINSSIRFMLKVTEGLGENKLEKTIKKDLKNQPQYFQNIAFSRQISAFFIHLERMVPCTDQSTSSLIFY